MNLTRAIIQTVDDTIEFLVGLLERNTPKTSWFQYLLNDQVLYDEVKYKQLLNAFNDFFSPISYLSVRGSQQVLHYGSSPYRT